MNYTLRIEGLEFRAPHGCYEVEQVVGGNYLVDVELSVKDAGAVEADDIDKTINYVEVYETVREQMLIPSRIIENVAWRIAGAIRQRFSPVLSATVTLSKLAPPLGGKASRVSVTIDR